MTKNYKNAMEALQLFYNNDDQTVEENAFIYYNKAINSSEINKEDLDNKAGLNSIRLSGRSYILKNMLTKTDIQTF